MYAWVCLCVCTSGSFPQCFCNSACGVRGSGSCFWIASQQQWWFHSDQQQHDATHVSCSQWFCLSTSIRCKAVQLEHKRSNVLHSANSGHPLALHCGLWLGQQHQLLSSCAMRGLPRLSHSWVRQQHNIQSTHTQQEQQTFLAIWIRIWQRTPHKLHFQELLQSHLPWSPWAHIQLHWISTAIVSLVPPKRNSPESDPFQFQCWGGYQKRILLACRQAAVDRSVEFVADDGMLTSFKDCGWLGFALEMHRELARPKP